MAKIDPTAQVASGAVIGRNVSIGAYCIVGADVSIGDDCEIQSHVNLAGHTQIGARNRIFPFASIGTEPQSAQYKGEPTRLVIGSDCVFREHVTINVGTVSGGGVTTIGNHCFIMVGSHIAHDCTVGNHVVFANKASLAGHCEIADHAFLSGFCAIHQFVRIGEHAMVGGLVGVPFDVIPYAIVIGHRGNLAGINRVGLRRRGFSAEVVRNIYRGYRAIFSGNGPPARRIDGLAETFADDPYVMRMIDFIRAAKLRRIAVPRRPGGSGEKSDDE